MPLGTNRALRGAVRPSEAENAEHELSVWAKRVVTIPLNMQELFEYTSGLIDYAGYAPRGLAEGSAGWLLFKYTWTGSDMTKKQVAYDSWAYRATATYA